MKAKHGGAEARRGARTIGPVEAAGERIGEALGPGLLPLDSGTLFCPRSSVGPELGRVGLVPWVASCRPPSRRWCS